MPGRQNPRSIMICRGCKQVLGAVNDVTIRVDTAPRQKETFVLSEPVQGYLTVWCDGCRALGELDQARVITDAKRSKKVWVQLEKTRALSELRPPTDHADW